jgi:hypothetical protein
VAVCATAVETRAIDRKKANPELRIMAGYIMRQHPARRGGSNRVTGRRNRARLGAALCLNRSPPP